MISLNVAKLRLFQAADIFCIQAPRVKSVSGRRIDGADINAIGIFYGLTALTIVKKMGRTDIVEILERVGAKE